MSVSSSGTAAANQAIECVWAVQPPAAPWRDEHLARTSVTGGATSGSCPMLTRILATLLLTITLSATLAACEGPEVESDDAEVGEVEDD